MRLKKHYFLILENEFTKLLNQSLAFSKLFDTADILPSGWCLYERIYDDISLYIVLAPNPKNDTYTIEIAWSKRKIFPSMLLPLFLDDNAVNGDFRFRIGEFWEEHDFWEFFAKREVDPVYANIANLKEAKLRSSANNMVNKLISFLPDYINQIR